MAIQWLDKPFVQMNHLYSWVLIQLLRINVFEIKFNFAFLIDGAGEKSTLLNWDISIFRFL